MKAFNKATASYDKHAVFQRKVGYDLIDFAKPYINFDAKNLLDAGCGTGYFSQYWKKQGYFVTALDFAENMLQYAKKNSSADKYVQADLESLSELSSSFDIIFSNLAFQWCNNFEIAINQLYQKTNQTIMFTTIVNNSLYELNHCRQIQNKCQQGNIFLEHEAILKCCNNFPIIWQVKEHKQTFLSLNTLLASLKGVGATNKEHNHIQGLTPPNYFKMLEDIYYQEFGGLNLTYYIFYGVIKRG